MNVGVLKHLPEISIEWEIVRQAIIDWSKVILPSKKEQEHITKLVWSIPLVISPNTHPTMVISQSNANYSKQVINELKRWVKKKRLKNKFVDRFKKSTQENFWYLKKTNPEIWNPQEMIDFILWYLEREIEIFEYALIGIDDQWIDYWRTPWKQLTFEESLMWEDTSKPEFEKIVEKLWAEPRYKAYDDKYVDYLDSAKVLILDDRPLAIHRFLVAPFWVKPNQTNLVCFEQKTVVWGEWFFSTPFRDETGCAMCERYTHETPTTKECAKLASYVLDDSVFAMETTEQLIAYLTQKYRTCVVRYVLRHSYESEDRDLDLIDSHSSDAAIAFRPEIIQTIKQFVIRTWIEPDIDESTVTLNNIQDWIEELKSIIEWEVWWLILSEWVFQNFQDYRGVSDNQPSEELRDIVTTHLVWWLLSVMKTLGIPKNLEQKVEKIYLEHLFINHK